MLNFNVQPSTFINAVSRVYEFLKFFFWEKITDQSYIQEKDLSVQNKMLYIFWC